MVNNTLALAEKGSSFPQSCPRDRQQPNFEDGAMNKQLQDFARQTLLDGLAQLPEDWQRRFKLMYGIDGGRRSVEDATAMRIEDTVKGMPEDKLDWAMEQIERSLTKLAFNRKNLEERTANRL